MAGLYAADGSINVSVVNGASLTGLHAPDGSWYVVKANGSQPVGEHHACGALWVTLDNTGPNSGNAADGSITVTTSPYNGTGSMKVTVVSGSLSGGGGGPTPTANSWFFFLGN